MTTDGRNASRELTRPKSNGSDADSRSATVEKLALSANRVAAIEHGLAQFQHTLEERDRLEDELRRAEHRKDLARAEVEMRDRTIAELNRRIAELEADRDRKMADFAVMETLFVSIRAQLDAFVRLPPPQEK
jgi:predicted RNase H-like nuclease (RuvC/YqgF family)